MKKIICCEAKNISKTIYRYIEWGIDNENSSFEGLYFLDENKSKINSFESIFDDKNIPKSMQKIFFVCDTKGLVLKNIKSSIMSLEEEREYNAYEAITGYPLNINKVGHSIYSHKNGNNFDIFDGNIVSYESMVCFFELLKDNLEIAKNYLECLKEIINLNYQFDEKDIPKYLTKK